MLKIRCNQLSQTIYHPGGDLKLLPRESLERLHVATQVFPAVPDTGMGLFNGGMRLGVDDHSTRL